LGEVTKFSHLLLPHCTHDCCCHWCHRSCTITSTEKKEKDENATVRRREKKSSFRKVFVGKMLLIIQIRPNARETRKIKSFVILPTCGITDLVVGSW